MEYNEYFYDCWNEMPSSIITDEYYDKNQELLDSITYDFYTYNEASGSIPPRMACTLLQRVFSNMLLYGIR